MSPLSERAAKLHRMPAGCRNGRLIAHIHGSQLTLVMPGGIGRLSSPFVKPALDGGGHHG
jgi:hypothetical protein